MGGVSIALGTQPLENSGVPSLAHCARSLLDETRWGAALQHSQQRILPLRPACLQLRNLNASTEAVTSWSSSSPTQRQAQSRSATKAAHANTRIPTVKSLPSQHRRVNSL